MSIIRGYFHNVVALAKLFSFFIQYNSIFVESFGLSDDWAFLCRETFLAVQSLVLGLTHTGASESFSDSLALAADSWESSWASLSFTASEIV